MTGSCDAKRHRSVPSFVLEVLSTGCLSYTFTLEGGKPVVKTASQWLHPQCSTCTNSFLTINQLAVFRSPSNGKFMALMRADKDMLRVSSLQNSLLKQNLSFNVAGDEFVQILHSGGNHWVTVSTVGTQCPTVRVFDRLHNSLPDSTKEQIASTKETEITLQYANVQKQPNDCDCGLFAIAFAMAIYNEQTPEEALFLVMRMREHLYDCIENKMMKHFPARKRKCTNKTRKIETLKVFCHCRLPAKVNMVLCERCQEWFHEKCGIIPDEVWTNDEFKWYYSKCNF